MRRALATVAVLLALPSAGGCKKPGSEDPTAGPGAGEALTVAQAREALEEAAASDAAEGLLTASVELATHFTLGEAAVDAAAELRDFVESQLPCAEVAIADATLTIDYGTHPGACLWHGHAFTGRHVVAVDRSEAGEVVVEHRWIAFADDRTSLDGTATVTWSAADPSRRVQHDLLWRRKADGRTGAGAGDRVQRPLPGGLAEGFSVDGSRSWTGTAGVWDLAIQGVEFRWADPVPQAGRYLLATPDDRSVELAFARVDDETIEVTVTSAGRSFAFRVTRAGATSEA